VQRQIAGQDAAQFGDGSVTARYLILENNTPFPSFTLGWGKKESGEEATRKKQKSQGCRPERKTKHPHKGFDLQPFFILHFLLSPPEAARVNGA